jgi:predicted metal-binding membrane protein
MHRAKLLFLGSWPRQLHRWVSIAFTATVIANFIVRAKGTPPAWVTYSPLIPLAILLLTGLYLFTLPYTLKRSISGGA